MKGVSVLAALALVVSGQAQKVIKVRNQHSRTLINTLAKEEFIVRGEARLMVKTDGETYEYLTQREGKYRLYENDRLIHVLPFARFDKPAFYAYSEKENGVWVTYAKIGGKTIGPYKDVRFFYTDDKRLDDLKGYLYETEEGRFIVDRKTNTTYGPYDDMRWHGLGQNQMLIIAKKGGATFVIDRTKTYGPYEAADYLYTESVDELAFTYAEKGIWRIHSKVTIDKSFVDKPELRFAPDGSWRVCGIPPNAAGKQYLFLQDGTSYLQTPESQTVYYPGMPVLTVERVGATQLPGLSGRFEYNQAYTVKQGDALLGEFYIETLASQLVGKTNQFYPLVLYRKLPQGISESRKEFYLLRADGQLTAPIPAACRYTLSLGGDRYGYVNTKEGTLYLNGEQQPYKGVEMVDLSSYPENWLMAAKEGYYTTFYKNGKVDPSATLEKKYAYPRFQSRSLPYIIVTQNDKSYAKAPQSSKLFGPVNARSVIAFSKNNAHYAEGDERAAQILIDGKVIGKGYGLVYNTNKNAFHWVEQEGQNLYLHTYELD